MHRDSYSPLKVFHHRSHLDVIRSGGHCMPIHVQLILTNQCNQNCSFCAYRTHGYSSSEQFQRNDKIPFSKVEEILKDCAAMGVKAIELTGGGEPTMYQHFTEVCDLLHRLGLGYAVVTNGSRAGGHWITSLLDARWVRFSIDASNEQSYATLRRADPAVFSRVRATIRTLVKLRGTSPDPIVGVGFVVTKDNWHEVLQAAINAKEDGADNFRISAVFQDGGADYFNRFYRDAVDLCCEAKKLQGGQFTVFDMFSERLEDLRQCHPSYPQCNVQRLVTYIGADLNVYRCCVLAYSQRGLLGSLKEQRFSDLWSRQAFGKFADFDARQCPRCMFNAKNCTIAYALNPNPDHVNFL